MDVRFSEVFPRGAQVLVLPINIFDEDGGMSECVRTWTELHLRDGRNALVIGRLDPRLAWANRRVALWFFSILAQVAGFKAAGLLMRSRIRRLLDSFPAVDVIQVVAHTLCSDSTAWSLLQCSTTARVVNTIHDPVPHLERRRFGKETVYRRVLVNSWKLATAHSRFFIHIHNAALLKGVSYPPEAKIIFYEIPIPPRRASRKRNDTLIWVGFMGRIEQYKGLDTYLEALRLIKKDRGDLAPSIKVLIAGLGDFDAAAFRDLGFETLIDNRYLSDDEFHQYMANLDLLVLPYIEATQSLVAAMGIAYGIRVIASEVGGIPYLVAPYERGTLLPPKDPRALAAAIVSQAEAVLRQDVTQAPGRPFRK